MSCPEQEHSPTGQVSTEVRPALERPTPAPVVARPVPRESGVACMRRGSSAVRPDMPAELAEFIAAYERGVRVVPGSPQWRRATTLWQAYYTSTTPPPVEESTTSESVAPPAAVGEELPASAAACATEPDPAVSPAAEEAPVRVAGVSLRAADAVAVQAGGALLAARTRTGAQAGRRAWDADVVEADAAAEAAMCAQACAAAALAPTCAEPADWAMFGTVIPVVSGHPGGGASVLAAVLADALATRGRRVLLVDAADPLRSGLATASAAEGPAITGPHRAVRIRQGWRGPTRTARLEFAAGVPVRSPGMVPPPHCWAPVTAGGVDVTVVDVGWDGWALAALPLAGPGGWLRRGEPGPRPVIAVRPTLPAARHVEQLLTRMEPWCRDDGGATPVAAVAVLGTKRVPAAMRAAAGAVLSPLLDDAVCIPPDRSIEQRGITAEPTPAAAQQAVTPLLTAWGLLSTTPAPEPRPRNPLLRRKSPPPKEGPIT